MALDEEGNIWMATDAALTEYIRATDRFKIFLSRRGPRFIQRSAHTLIRIMLFGFGDDDGLCRLNADGKIGTFLIGHLM